MHNEYNCDNKLKCCSQTVDSNPQAPRRVASWSHRSHLLPCRNSVMQEPEQGRLLRRSGSCAALTLDSVARQLWWEMKSGCKAAQTCMCSVQTYIIIYACVCRLKRWQRSIIVYSYQMSDALYIPGICIYLVYSSSKKIVMVYTYYVTLANVMYQAYSYYITFILPSGS